LNIRLADECGVDVKLVHKHGRAPPFVKLLFQAAGVYHAIKGRVKAFMKNGAPQAGPFGSRPAT
jgi:hypothetical protein